MPTPEAMLAELLFRAGTFLLLVAYLFASTWLIFVYARNIYAHWGRWETWPVPDKRATKHMASVLVLVGADLLFLWFAMVWFTL